MNGKKWNCIAAALGAGCVSGSEIALFYAQLGGAAHLAALITGMVYTAFYVLCGRLKRETGANNLPQALRRRMGAGAGTAAMLLHLTAMTVAALRSVNMCGKIASIMLPIPNAYLVGAAVCTVTSVFIFRDRGAAGMLWLVFCTLGWLFLQIGGRGAKGGLAHVQLLLENSIPAALLSGALHGSMMCAITGSAMLESAEKEDTLILLPGIVLILLLETAILSMKTAGNNALALRQPFIAMAAAWGIAGQIIISVMMVVGAAFTLSVCLRGISQIIRERYEL